MMELLLIGAACFLIGYISGKRAGRKIGQQEGTALAPLLLREQSFDRGQCILCQRSLDVLNISFTAKDS